MSSKKKNSRLRLRSQCNNVVSRNKPITVISHYFKKSSSENDELTSKEICDHKSDDLSFSENTDTSSNVKTSLNQIPDKLRTELLETQKLLNLSDDLSDFSTPKPIKRVIPKIFEPNFKPKPAPKRNKKLLTNKKITEESRKFLYESKDYNQEHLHLAIALSKSIQDLENPQSNSSDSSCGVDSELTPTQENVLKIRKKLIKFQFNNSDAFHTKTVDGIKTGKLKKNRNHPFMSVLIRRTNEDRENIIKRKISSILIEKSNTDTENQFYSDFIICDTLRKYYCHEKFLFKKAELMENENFYTDNKLVSPTTAKCGNLLRDWSKILGREITPPREIQESNINHSTSNETEISKVDSEFKQNLEVDSQTQNPKYLNQEISQELKIKELQQTTELNNSPETLEVSKQDLTIPCLELSVKIPHIVMDNVNSNKPDCQDSNTLENTPNENENIEKNTQIINKNITIRSITPDLFSDTEDEVAIENFANKTFIIESKADNTLKIATALEEEIYDLTQSSTSDKIIDLSQSSDTQISNNVESNTDESNDSLFDLPKIDIKYTINKPKSKENIHSCDEIENFEVNKSKYDGNQINNRPKTQSPMKNTSNKRQMSPSKSKSNNNLNEININVDFENHREIHVDLSLSSNSDDNCSQQISTKSTEHLINESKILTESFTPKSRRSSSYFKLQRKSKSFIDEQQIQSNNSRLRKFNSFVENISDDHCMNKSQTENFIPKSRLTDPDLSPVKGNQSLSIFEGSSSDHCLKDSRNSIQKSDSNISNFKLKRKSKSFCNENHKTSFRKFNSFMENFDYEFETNQFDLNNPNLDSQTETDDSLIIISDDELNYSCSTPYRNVKREKSFGNDSKTSSNSTSIPSSSPGKSFTDKGKSSQNCIKSLTKSSICNESPLKKLNSNISERNKPEKPTNISSLFGDSFERDLRRTTSLWDRVCGKKQVDNEKSESPQSPKKTALHFETPTTQIEIKVHDITPMPNYDTMTTPNIHKELDKYGLKCLKRRRATQILKYIYEQTHPIDENHSEMYSDTEDCNNQQSKRPKRRLTTGLDDFVPVPQCKIEIVGDLLTKNCSENDLIFETRQSSKIASCRLPFHIAWFNYISENPDLQLKILKYIPIQLEDICVHFKQLGFKYHANDILSFLDKKCITIRTSQNNHRNKKPSNTRKRY